ncbi:ERAD-associated protein [Coemansia helicoidea]|uniref:ERAD-associated protein n=1 Tax=Coemansia helicoidea TaxID=1286919 RepID=A0ACC1KRG4_9FUNG|nr:ERAD-associated protein [Coemansia helicoidea]
MASSETQCRMAVASYKFVAENGDWLHSPMPEAAAAYHRGDLDAATVDYIRAAEMGYGAGQQNAALLLEAAAKRVGAAEGPDAWPLFGSRQAHVWQTLAYWTRAANQNMPDARAKQGDYYYHGWGVERSAEQAAAAYTLAAEADANGLAMWSLGWMHENGIGVKRDFHLAKRWYDKSIEANQDGRLANHISLARLAVKYLWAWASGEDVGDAPLFFAPEPEPHEEYDYGDDGDDDAVGHAAADGDDGAAADAHAGQLRPARQAPGGDWEQDPAAADADDFGMGGEEEAGDGDGDETLSGNIFFVVLLLAAGGMFLPFR